MWGCVLILLQGVPHTIAFLKIVQFYAGKSRTQNVSTVITRLLAACPQCYCGEIRQMLAFQISLYCPKAYHRPDHSICIAEQHISLNPTPLPRLKLRAVSGLWPSFCNILAETKNFVLCVIFLFCLVSKLEKLSSLGLKPRTDV
jgi:hypothetical protein